MKMPIYRIFHTVKRIYNELWAESSLDACALLSWNPDDCWVRQYNEVGSGGWKKPVDHPELGSMSRMRR